MEVNLPFLLCFALYLRAIFLVQAPGGLYLEVRFNGGFFRLPDWGAYIWRVVYMEGFIFGILRYLNSFASQVLLGRVVQKVDKSIHWINLYLVDSVIY